MNDMWLALNASESFSEVESFQNALNEKFGSIKEGNTQTFGTRNKE